jgi:hypothetical protein
MLFFLILIPGLCLLSGARISVDADGAYRLPTSIGAPAGVRLAPPGSSP